MVNESPTVLTTGTQVPLKGIKRVAARRMVQAWEAPVFHLSTVVKMEAALTLAKKKPGNTVTDVLIQAVASVLIENPELNAHYVDEVVTLYSEINIGIAVATSAGLMVPVVQNVGGEDLNAIAAKRSDVVNKARDGKLSMPDIEGATFTISNLGPLGIDSFDAIVNPPQVAILAIGSTKESAVVEEGSIVIRKIATFTLTCDHRALDGATGAKFLSSLRNIIESMKQLK